MAEREDKVSRAWHSQHSYSFHVNERVRVIRAVAATGSEGPLEEGMNQAKALQVQQEVQLRFLCPADVGEVKKLCTEWFPIE